MKSSKYPESDSFSKDRSLTSKLVDFFKLKKTNVDLKDQMKMSSQELPFDPIGIYTKDLARKVRDQKIKTQQAKKLWEEKQLELSTYSSVEKSLVEEAISQPFTQEAEDRVAHEFIPLENVKVVDELKVHDKEEVVEKVESSKTGEEKSKSALGSSLEILKDSGDQVFGKIYKMQMFSKSGNAMGSSMQALRVSGDQIGKNISRIPTESSNVMGSTLEALKNSGSHILGKIPKVPKTSNAMGTPLIDLIESLKRSRK